MDYFLKRLREPSTWAGFAAVGAAFGIDPAMITTVGQIALGVGGLAAMLITEKKPSP